MRCLQKAEEEGVEFTSPIPDMDIDYDRWAMSILNPDDVRVICFYVSMEVSAVHLYYTCVHNNDSKNNVIKQLPRRKNYQSLTSY